MRLTDRPEAKFPIVFHTRATPGMEYNRKMPLTFLPPEQLAAARPLFDAMAGHHLILPSILAGFTPARVWVDDLGRPRAAAALFHNKLYLLGSCHETHFNASLGEMLSKQVFPELQQQGAEVMLIFPSHTGWAEQVTTLLDGAFAQVYPDAQRQVFNFDAGKNTLVEWRGSLPDGFSLRPVDSALLADDGWSSIEYLREETQSERVSIEDFLAHSFGVCLTREHDLVAWCLSEYNCGDRCEVGIATVDQYQRRGFGTVVGAAFVEEALRRGYRSIGWHCWSRNLPSAALARRIGYTQSAEEKLAFCVFPTPTD